MKKPVVGGRVEHIIVRSINKEQLIPTLPFARSNGNQGVTDPHVHDAS